VLGVWARIQPTAPWELSLVLAAEQQPGPGRDIVSAVNTLGDLPVWIPFVAAIALLVGRARGWVPALAVALTLAADAAAFGIKLLTERARPDTVATEHFFGIDAFAFPSGHVVRAVALVAVLIWLVTPPPRRLGLAMVGATAAALVMGFARVSLGVHWPTDAMGGFLLGLAWLALTGLVLDRHRLGRNENERRTRPATEHNRPPPP
jgi:undecaprenyl-diphosphatase